MSPARTAPWSRRAGCDGYITKPIDTRTLAATVDLYLNPSGEAHPGRL